MPVSRKDNSVSIENLGYSYGERRALDGISFRVGGGEVFGLIGPNGGGKSTTFKIVSTLLPPQSGRVEVCGFDAKTQSADVRSNIGVVFQNPGLDKKLTVAENLIHQGHLYGLSGPALRERARHLLAFLGLEDRARDRVETLSGGLKRRLEIGKGILHAPKVLILDEPTTGLDPAARHAVWEYLKRLNKEEGLTILLTTHFLEEAEGCHQIALMDRGNIVCQGDPQALKQTLGGDIITVKGQHAGALKNEIEQKLSVHAVVVDDEVRIQLPKGHEFIPRLVAALPDAIRSVTLGKPTLEDLFIAKTGHRYWEARVTA